VSYSERRFTGQRAHDELGLYHYQARWYDPALGRFVQPDSIVPDPGNPIDWDRYGYVRDNPVKYIDPSGQKLDPFGADFGGQDVIQLGGVYLKGGPGTPYNGYAAEAEGEYTGHSGGGTSIPATESIGLANFFFVWLRDNTPAREWLGSSLPSVFGTPEVYGQVFYDGAGLEGIRVTGVSITNDSHEVIWVDNIYIELYSEGANARLRRERVYPNNHASITPPEYGIAQEKSWSGIVNVTSSPINPNQYAIVRISVSSESRRFATIAGKVIVP
jgi:RHS repeat-associated protein